MIYNFDEIIDRTHNNAAKYDERIKKFGTQDVIPLWIADMDFRVAKPIEDALADKAHQGAGRRQGNGTGVFLFPGDFIHTTGNAFKKNV